MNPMSLNHDLAQKRCRDSVQQHNPWQVIPCEAPASLNGLTKNAVLTPMFQESLSAPNSSSVSLPGQGELLLCNLNQVTQLGKID
jgi:hypothetical protein